MLGSWYLTPRMEVRTPRRVNKWLRKNIRRKGGREGGKEVGKVIIRVIIRVPPWIDTPSRTKSTIFVGTCFFSFRNRSISLFTYLFVCLFLSIDDYLRYFLCSPDITSHRPLNYRRLQTHTPPPNTHIDTLSTKTSLEISPLQSRLGTTIPR